MKLLPGLFSDSFNDVFRDPFFSTSTTNHMKTDISEVDGNFLLDMELPGYKKEDIQFELKDGYLTIQASRNNTTEEKDKNGNIIRQERFTSSCSCNFYVGDGVQPDQIKANSTNGELSVCIPKATPPLQEKKYITID